MPVPGEARSHLHDGRLVVWRPAASRLRVAVDAEVRREPPPHVAEHASGDVWEWWTRLEVACKLHDVPVLEALRHGPPTGGAVRVVEQDGIVIALGARDMNSYATQ